MSPRRSTSSSTRRLHGYVAGGGDGALLAQAFDDDDWFTDHDSNAYDAGHLLRQSRRGANGIRRRGRQPRRRRAGAARPTAARQSTCCSSPAVRRWSTTATSRASPVPAATSSPARTCSRRVTPDYVVDQNIGSDATPADDNFDPGHPLYRHISELNDLRTDHPTLATGAQIVHPVDGPVFAFSRIDRDERIEYVVVTNSSDDVARTGPSFQVVSPTPSSPWCAARRRTDDVGGRRRAVRPGATTEHHRAESDVRQRAARQTTDDRDRPSRGRGGAADLALPHRGRAGRSPLRRGHVRRRRRRCRAGRGRRRRRGALPPLLEQLRAAHRHGGRRSSPPSTTDPVACARTSSPSPSEIAREHTSTRPPSPPSTGSVGTTSRSPGGAERSSTRSTSGRSPTATATAPATSPVCDRDCRIWSRSASTPCG